VPARTPASSSAVIPYQRAIGAKVPASKVFLREKDNEPVIVPYVVHHAPDTNAAKIWLMNRRPQQWRERQLVEATDPLASMSPEQRLANVIQIMAKARALLAANPPQDEDVMDAEHEETAI
jgi:hypothetical protein